MSRDFKFRVWDKESISDENYKSGKKGIMFTQGTPDLETLASFAYNQLWNQSAFDNGDKILMQFTELHDKNGKEIWEGDICRDYISGFLCEVQF